jgi:hypothetical protein
VKRGVVGTFHKVSAKYLPLYIAEFQFCYAIINLTYGTGLRVF